MCTGLSEYESWNERLGDTELRRKRDFNAIDPAFHNSTFTFLKVLASVKMGENSSRCITGCYLLKQSEALQE